MEALFSRLAVSGCWRTASSAIRQPTRAILATQPTTTPSQVRGKATGARARRALRIPPHPSFLGSNNTTAVATADTAATASPPADEIIYNPPESAASVYHTPLKFLPPSDPRRRANLDKILSSSSSSSPTSAPSADVFPMIQKPPVLKPRHHLTIQDIEEMRRLRAEDPVKNSVLSLARRFKCTTLFVLMCCQAPKEHREKMKALEEKIKARWGPRRRAAREERARRNTMLYNGEL